MSLRLAEGLDLARFEAIAGRPLAAATIDRLAALDLLMVRGGRLIASVSGRMVLNGILRELSADL